MILLFNKPYRVLCQFSAKPGKASLADYVSQVGVYPAGRLDYDSEGLVVLTDDGWLQHRLSHPRHKLWKEYWAQVEGAPSDGDLDPLRHGVALKDGRTRPAEAALMDTPAVWEREPPIRHRKQIPTAWIRLCIREGRNRQIRRMTAHVGYPTLRLIRYRIGDWTLQGLEPGAWRRVD